MLSNPPAEAICNNFQGQTQASTSKQRHRLPSRQRRLIIDTSASGGKRFGGDIIQTAVKSPKNQSAAATRNKYFSDKTKAKAVKMQSCLPSHGRFDSTMVFSSHDERWEMPSHPADDD